MSGKSPKPLGFSQTTGAPKYVRPHEGPLGFLPVGGHKGLPGRPRAVQEKLLRPIAIGKDADEETAAVGSAFVAKARANKSRTHIKANGGI